MNIDVQNLWKMYCQDVIPNANIMEKKVARQAFFAGAGVVVGIYHVSEGQLSPRLEAEPDLEDQRQGKLTLVRVADEKGARTVVQFKKE